MVAPLVAAAAIGGAFEMGSTAIANKGNRKEAQKNRDWQESQATTAFERNKQAATTAYERNLYMSNTSHQREMADMKAAGLNPILSAGKGASTPNAPAATATSGSGAQAKMEKANVSHAVTAAANSAMDIKRKKALLPLEESLINQQAWNQMEQGKKAAAERLHIASVTQQTNASTRGINLDNTRKAFENIQHALTANVYRGDLGGFLTYAREITKNLGVSTKDILNLIPATLFTKGLGKTKDKIIDTFSGKTGELVKRTRTYSK